MNKTNFYDFMKRLIKKEWIITWCVNLYLYTIPVFLIWYYSYMLHDDVKPLGYFFSSILIFVLYLFYLILNHTIINKYTNKAILKSLEILTLLSLIAIAEADIYFETDINLLFLPTF